MTTSRTKVFYTLYELLEDTEDVRHDDSDKDHRRTSISSLLVGEAFPQHIKRLLGIR